MNLPSVVFAEAAIRSRFADKPGSLGTSILNTKVPLTAENLKQFLPEPQTVKQAVQILKATGFSVLSVGKYIVTIAGPFELYQDTFAVKLIGNQVGVDGNDAPLVALTIAGKTTQRNLIDTSSDSELSNFLDGIAISQPIGYAMPKDYTGIEKDPPTITVEDQMAPKDIPIQQLGLGAHSNDYRDYFLWPEDSAEVVIIDSGCCAQHPYFDGFKIDVLPIAPMTDSYMNEIEIALENMYRKKEEVEGIRPSTDDSKLELSHLQATLHSLLRAQGAYDDEGSDLGGHGTAMVASTLAVAPKAKITVIKHRSEWSLDAALWSWVFDQYKNSKGIISCSWSNRESRDQALQGVLNLTDAGRHHIFMLTTCDVTVLFATGNFVHDQTQSNYSRQTRIEEVIAVGGAYRTSTTGINASDATLAEVTADKRRVPDICGWCGPLDDERLWVPIDPDSREEQNPQGWQLINGGSSSATAQVAGLCAILKTRWAGATSDDLRGMLMMTADRISSGSFAHIGSNGSYDKIAFNALNPTTPLYPLGMVNIERAYLKAQELDADPKKVEEFRDEYQKLLKQLQQLNPA